MMAATYYLLMVLCAVGMVRTNGPFPYPFNCAQHGVKCANGGTCTVSGNCSCNPPFKGDDCGLDTTKIPGADCSANPCQNNGDCTDGGVCYCNSDTYGSNCSLSRLNVWCGEDRLFVNVCPHGDDNFEGRIKIRNGISYCDMNEIDANTPLVATTYPYVVDANQNPVASQLRCFWKELPYVPAADTCAATKTELDEGIEYTTEVELQYSPSMSTSKDNVLMFKCSIKSNQQVFSADTSMTVSALDPSTDFEKIDVNVTIHSVLMLIADLKGSAITNTITLGDEFDILFTKTDETFVGFKITSCTARNYLTKSANGTDGTKEYDVTFLTDGCPADDATILYRAYPKFQDANTYVLPMIAFRFHDSTDYVYFQCDIQLCTDENSPDCVQKNCDPDAVDDGDSNSQNGTDTENPPTENENSQNGTNNENSDAPTVRRRRRSADDNHRSVTGAIKVANPNAPSSPQQNTEKRPETDGELETEVDPEDCLQHSEVVVIIAIFSSVLFLMIVAVVVLVICLLRPRPKVVDASSAESNTSDTVNRYSLPRLSLNTTM